VPPTAAGAPGRRKAAQTSHGRHQNQEGALPAWHAPGVPHNPRPLTPARCRLQGTKGNAVQYLTRNQAIKKLQLRLSEFR
jgi:hypothetical protein